MPDNPFDTTDEALFEIPIRADGPAGTLPFTPDMAAARFRMP